MINVYLNHWSQWPCSLRHKSAAAWLLGLQVRIPLRADMFVSCICCMLCSCVYVCVCVFNCLWSRNPNNEAANAQIGLLWHRRKWSFKSSNVTHNWSVELLGFIWIFVQDHKKLNSMCWELIDHERKPKSFPPPPFFFCNCHFCVGCLVQDSVTYRVIQEESALLWEMIVWVILSKKVRTNMGPILNGYGVMGIF